MSTTKEKIERPLPGLDIFSLLVLQVSSLVSCTADAISRARSDDNVLDLEAELYRMLAVNCGDKAKMAEESLQHFRYRKCRGKVGATGR